MTAVWIVQGSIFGHTAIPAPATVAKSIFPSGALSIFATTPKTTGQEKTGSSSGVPSRAGSTLGARGELSAEEREAWDACEQGAQAMRGEAEGGEARKEKGGEVGNQAEGREREAGENGEAENGEAMEGADEEEEASRKRAAERGGGEMLPPPPRSPAGALGPQELLPDFRFAGGMMPVNPWERERDVGGRTAERVWAFYQCGKKEGWLEDELNWNEIKGKALTIGLPGMVTMSVNDFMDMVKWAIKEGCIRKTSSARTAVQFAEMLYPKGWRSIPSSPASSSAQSPAPKAGRNAQGERGRFIIPRKEGGAKGKGKGKG